jgi:hypothetical protein
MWTQILVLKRPNSTACALETTASFLPLPVPCVPGPREDARCPEALGTRINHTMQFRSPSLWSSGRNVRLWDNPLREARNPGQDWSAHSISTANQIPPWNGLSQRLTFLPEDRRLGERDCILWWPKSYSEEPALGPSLPLRTVKLLMYSLRQHWCQHWLCCAWSPRLAFKLGNNQAQLYLHAVISGTGLSPNSA